jgi:hypothetical protein
MTDVNAEKIRKRVRAHRERRRRGIRYIPIRLTEYEVVELVKRQFLEPAGIKDRQAVAMAVEVALSDLYANVTA